jgi:predicted ribonuclease YlaK
LKCYHDSAQEHVIHKKIADWKIDARNKEQSFAIDMLMDPNIKIVSLVGRAGSGKTLMAIAAGLQQTIGLRSDENHYDRLIVSRPGTAFRERHRIPSRHNGRKNVTMAYANSR